MTESAPGRQAEQVDIAIVGGGISGLYCCLQLARAVRDNRPLCINGTVIPAEGLKIALYERSNALGGRIETWSINVKDPSQDAAPGSTTDAHNEFFQAELGPMRIEPRDQPLLDDLLRFLGISEDAPEESGRRLVKFPAYAAEGSSEVQFKLEGEEAEQQSLLDLLLLAIRRICELVVEDEQPMSWGRNGELTGRSEPVTEGERMQTPAMRFWHQFLGTSSVRRRYWKGELLDWITSLDDGDYDFIRRKLRINGVRLCDMGFWNLLSEVLSHLAVIRIRDWGSYYHLIGENPNAAEHLVMWLRAMRSTNTLRGISGGMIQIVHGLEVLVRAHGIEPRFDHTLTRVDAIDDDGRSCMRLQFEGRPPVEARHVILAMPQRPLQKLALGPNNPIAEVLDSVIGIGLLKLFFVVEQPWWEDHRPANRYANDLPCRELHYWKSLDRTKGFVMLYTDRPALHFWADYELGSAADLEGPQDQAVRWFLKNERARTELDTGNPRLWRRFVQYARDYEHNDFTIDRLLACGLRDWSRDPYGAAVHVWRPRRESWNVMKTLTAFSLGGAAPSVHVCTDAYSDHQGFIEGALRSTARVLTFLSTGDAADRFNARTFLDQWALGDA